MATDDRKRTLFFLDQEFIEDGRTIDLVSIGLVCEDGRELYAVSSEFDASKAGDWVKEHVLPKLDRGPRIPVARIRDEVLRFVGATRPAFWGYYADYDWVVFCRLFGRMIDLPEGWPKYCRDVKQWCDLLGNPRLPSPEHEHHALFDARWVRQAHAFLSGLARRREDPCDTCGGSGVPESGRPCICGGAGTGHAEKVGLRKKVFELAGRNETLEARRELLHAALREIAWKDVHGDPAEHEKCPEIARKALEGDRES